MTYYNTVTTPRQITFYGETEDDLKNMPTTTTPGKGKYKNNGVVEIGTVAQILTEDSLEYYMLGSNGWIDVTKTYSINML